MNDWMNEWMNEKMDGKKARIWVWGESRGRRTYFPIKWNPALTDFKRLTNFIYYRHNSVVANIRIKRKLVERTRIDISLRRNSLKSGSVRAGYNSIRKHQTFRSRYPEGGKIGSKFHQFFTRKMIKKRVVMFKRKIGKKGGNKKRKKNKARYMVMWSRTVGQEQKCKNWPTDWLTKRPAARPPYRHGKV